MSKETPAVAPKKRGRKKKVEQINKENVADGKDYSAPSRPPGRTVAQILGFKHSKYKTDSAEEYKEGLSKLTRYDLQLECTRVGVTPHDERGRMITRLLKQFNDFIMSTVQKVDGPPIKVSKSAFDILNRYSDLL